MIFILFKIRNLFESIFLRDVYVFEEDPFKKGNVQHIIRHIPLEAVFNQPLLLSVQAQGKDAEAVDNYSASNSTLIMANG